MTLASIRGNLRGAIPLAAAATRPHHESMTAIKEADAAAAGPAAEPIPASTTAVLYGLSGAPPSMAAQLMLEHKGIRYQRVNLLAGRHQKSLRKRGFDGVTAPAMELDGQRIQTNHAIARALEAAVPEPPLFPRHPRARVAVEEAEKLCDEHLQPTVRRIALWALHSDLDSVSFHPRLGPLVPQWLPALLKRRGIRQAMAHRGVTPAVAAEDARRLPHLLDRFDAWVAGGVLNGADLNAADFHVGPLVAFLGGVRDIGPDVTARPAYALANRVLG
jgi:glutathione S-transferase